MSLNSIRLVGQHVSLIALNPGEHAQPLHVASHGEQREEPRQHLRDGPFADADLQMLIAIELIWSTCVRLSNSPVSLLSILLPVHYWGRLP
jgi:hypothetical protein